MQQRLYKTDSALIKSTNVLRRARKLLCVFKLIIEIIVSMEDAHPILVQALKALRPLVSSKFDYGSEDTFYMAQMV